MGRANLEVLLFLLPFSLLGVVALPFVEGGFLATFGGASGPLVGRLQRLLSMYQEFRSPVQFFQAVLLLMISLFKLLLLLLLLVDLDLLDLDLLELVGVAAWDGGMAGVDLDLVLEEGLSSVGAVVAFLGVATATVAGLPGVAAA